eukprot:6195779-Pleurochrysis_carterae.AAC.1
MLARTQAQCTLEKRRPSAGAMDRSDASRACVCDKTQGLLVCENEKGVAENETARACESLSGRGRSKGRGRRRGRNRARKRARERERERETERERGGERGRERVE